MLDYPIPNNKNTEEGKVIQTILHNNHYHGNIKKNNTTENQKKCQKMTNDVHRHKKNSVALVRERTIPTKKRKKWATVTHVGKEVYHITKLFRKKKKS